MTDIIYAGNISRYYDLDLLVDSLNNSVPDRIGPGEDYSNKENKETIDLWNKLNYKPYFLGGSVKWGMFFPGVGFDMEFVHTVLSYLKTDKFTSGWISKIEPGYCAAPHIDGLDANSTLNRLHIHLQDSIVGHSFFVGSTQVTDYKKGDIYIWKDPYAWHGGSNFGFKSKFLFNMY